MKKRMLIYALTCSLALACLPCEAYASGEISADTVIGNIISNGTFESGISGWTASENLKISSENEGEAYCSAKSVKLFGTGKITAKMSAMYPQETYEMSVKAKAVSDSVTVKLKYNYAKKGETEFVSGTISPSDGWTDISGIFKWQDNTNYSYKGAELKNGGGTVSVEVSGDCLIDEVLVRPSNEKIINPKSAENLGGWLFRKIGNLSGNLTYNQEESALCGTDLQKINIAMFYPLALEKGAEYTLAAEVKSDAETDALVYFGSETDKHELHISDNSWTKAEYAYTSAYPLNSESVTRAGTMLAFSGKASDNTANLAVKNVSIKKSMGAKANAELCMPDEIEQGTEIIPAVVLENADGTRFKYTQNGIAVVSGCIKNGEAFPAFTPEEKGIFEVSLTPFNRYGYGKTQTKAITIKKLKKKSDIAFFVNGKATDFYGETKKEQNILYAEVRTLAGVIGAAFGKTDGGCTLKRGLNRLYIEKNSIFAKYNDIMAIITAPEEIDGEICADITEICKFMGTSVEIDEDGSVHITINEAPFLVNTVKAMRSRKCAKLAFSGGAATYGRGAGEKGSSYTKLFIKKLRNYYGSVEFIELNNALGDTGSDLELYRAEEILRQKPDVLFIDFCSEDRENTYDDEVKNIERLILEAKRLCINTDIVILGSWHSEFESGYAENTDSEAVRACKYLADKYNAAFVDIGKSLYDYAKNSGKTVQDSYMRYKYYPNDSGHEFYAQKLFGFFCDNIKNSAEPLLYRHEAFGIPDTTLRGCTVAADKTESDFEKTSLKIGGREYEVLLGSDGEEMTFEFSGNTVGILWISGIDTGEIEYSVDGGTILTAAAFDDEGTRGYKMSYKILAKNLTEGSHVLKIKADGKHPELSLGSKVMIKDFLVGYSAAPVIHKNDYEVYADSIEPAAAVPGRSLFGNITVKNNTENAENFVSIIACYDSSNALIDCTVQKKTAESGTECELNPKIAALSSKTAKIKQMLWRQEKSCEAVPVCTADTVWINGGKE